MVITASSAIDFSYTFWSSASANTKPDIDVDWSQLFACGIFETEDDYKKFVNDLHLEEFRKDKFRNIMIVPKEITYYYEAPFRTDMRPPTKNFHGKDHQRF